MMLKLACLLGTLLAGAAAQQAAGGALSPLDAPAARCQLQMRGDDAANGSLSHFSLVCKGRPVKVALYQGQNAARSPSYKAFNNTDLPPYVDGHPQHFDGVEFVQPDGCYPSAFFGPTAPASPPQCLVAICPGNGDLEFEALELARLQPNVRYKGVLCILGPDTSVTITDATLRDNSATGVLYVLSGASATLHRPVVLNNTARRPFGVIGAHGARRLSIIMPERSANSTANAFTGNTALRGGGVVHANRTQLTLQGGRFFGNTQQGDACGGGAVVAIRSVVSITNTSFYNSMASCDAARGGALLLTEQSNATITRAVFSSNRAVGPSGRGGAIFASMLSRVDVANSWFDNNMAEMGGAVATSFSAVNFSLSLFTNNTASSGGAIHASGGWPSWSEGLGVSLLLHNTTLANNMALNAGGAVCAQHALPPKELVMPAQPIGALQVHVSGGTRFERNNVSLGSGGALHCRGAELHLYPGAGITNNSASQDGGGVFVSHMQLQPNDAPVRSRLVLHDASSMSLNVRDNSAGRGGGGFALADEDVGGFELQQLLEAGGLQVDQRRALNQAAGFSSDAWLPGLSLCEVGYKLQRDWWGSPCVPCGAHYYSLDGNSTSACADCTDAPGLVCKGGANVSVEEGYWLDTSLDELENATRPRAFRCVNRDACINVTRHTYNLTAPWGPELACNASLGYTGPLCGQCLPGYTQPVPFTCRECSPHSKAWLGGLLAANAVVLYVLWISAWWGNKDSAVRFEWSDVVKVGLFYAQAFPIIGRLYVYSWGPNGAGGGPAWEARIKSFFELFASVFSFTEIQAYAYCVWQPKPGLAWGYVAALATLVLPLCFMVAALVLHVLVNAAASLPAICVAAAEGAVWLCQHIFGLVRDGLARLKGSGQGGGARAAAAAAAHPAPAAGADDAGAGAGAAQPGCCAVFARGAREALGVDAGSVLARSWWVDLSQRLLLLLFVALSYFFPSYVRVAWALLYACKQVIGDAPGVAVQHNSIWIFGMSSEHLQWCDDYHSRWQGLGWAMLVLFVVLYPLLLASLSFLLLVANRRGCVAPCWRAAAGAAGEGAPPPPEAFTRLGAYLTKTYRRNCHVWEGWMQLRLVGLTAVAVFSPKLGPILGLVLLGVVLLVFLLLQVVYKPHRDMVMHHLQIMTYACLLLVVVGGVMSFLLYRYRPDPGTTEDALKNSLRAIVSGLVIAINCIFGAWCLLIIVSLWTRDKRAQLAGDQLSKLGRPHGWWYVLGLGCSPASTWGLPLMHAGLWSVAPADDPHHALPSTCANIRPWLAWLCCWCRWWPGQDAPDAGVGEGGPPAKPRQPPGGGAAPAGVPVVQVMEAV